MPESTLMTIQEIFSQDLPGIIKTLTSQRKTEDSEIEKYKKQLDPNEHDVFNRALRPDKTRPATRKNANGEDEVTTVTTKVNRVGVAIQKIIVDRAVAFLFGNPVTISTKSELPTAEDIVKAINLINKDVKIDSFNRRVARHLFSSTEVAEYWTALEGEQSERYGFPSPKKLRCYIFSPLKGDKLYPYFDDYGDMVAFSRGFIKKDNEGKDVEYLDVWTDKNYIQYIKGESDWTENKRILNAQGKIPVIYAKQDNVEWYDVQNMIDRLEKLLSNNSDVNDRHASPILVAKGKVANAIGDFVQIEDGGDMEYKSWSQATGNVELEYKTLLNLIYTQTQTPDISFDSVRGIGNAASGEGLKMLFMDAHLKVQNKMEVFDEYLTRRYSVIKSFLAEMKKDVSGDISNVGIDVRVTPYMVNSETTTLDNLGQAVSSGIMSKETAVELNPYVEDSKAEFERIKAEQDAADKSPSGLDEVMNDVNG